MAKDKIDIQTRLGPRSVYTNRIVRFPRGLAGFEKERAFVLLQVRPDAPLLVLQSINNPQVGLLVADPYSFLESYPVTIGDAEQTLLQIKAAKDAAILVTVSIPNGDLYDATLNLTGPIVINYQSRVGMQIPQTIDGPMQVRLKDLMQREQTGSNSVNAKEEQRELQIEGRKINRKSNNSKTSQL